jgi:hypothetical protein
VPAQATWYSAEEADTLVPPIQTRLRSIHSKQVRTHVGVADPQVLWHSLGMSWRQLAYGAVAVDESVCTVQGVADCLLDSLCVQATVISFSNKSPFRVRALWIDFSGNEVSAACVPGSNAVCPV